MKTSDTISRFQISTANVDGESLIKVAACPYNCKFCALDASHKLCEN